METLLAQIEAFLEQHQIAATRFGDEAMGDRHLVRTLRAGRRLWPETEDKVRCFMEAYGSAAGDPASSGNGDHVSAEAHS
jgi:hypothetical protein